MTKEELLKIYSAYLPYGLEFISSKDNGRYLMTDVKTVSEYPIWASTEWNDETLKYEPEINLKPSGGIGNGFRLEEVKPILYDLSYLTKEIEHEGETFVPIKRIYEINGWEWDYEEGNEIDEIGICSDLNILTYATAQLLLSWHLNVFSIPEDQFINKATLTNK